MRAIATAANEAPSTGAAIRSCLQRVCAHVGWPVATAWICQSGMLTPSGIWVTRDGQNFDRLIDASHGFSFTAGEGLPGAVLANRAPKWVADVETCADFPRASYGELGVRAAFAFPVLV